jgi:hypothetical protein
MIVMDRVEEVEKTLSMVEMYRTAEVEETHANVVVKGLGRKRLRKPCH